MFKNLTIYRLPADFLSTPAQLSEFTEGLRDKAFTPCGQMETMSAGWVAPQADGDLVAGVSGQMLISLCTEKKILPGAVITRKAKERAAELENKQGFKPGRKQMRDLKEQVTDELLPSALSNHSITNAWIDTENGWLAVDTASGSKADDFLKMLMKSTNNLPITTLRPIISPGSAMTSWLDLDDAPPGFTIDMDAELVAMGGTATVRFKNQTLDAADVRRHIAAGKRCTQLAMTWNDRISFVLTDALTIKRITPLDILRENVQPSNHEQERFEADLLLMAGAFHQMISALVTCLGGEQPPAESTPAAITNGQVYAAVSNISKLLREDGATATISLGGEVVAHLEGDGPDPMYDQAVDIVRKNDRASISLVQRHLRIGYNRAARLLEEMELKGAVSAMQANGNRVVLKAMKV